MSNKKLPSKILVNRSPPIILNSLFYVQNAYIIYCRNIYVYINPKIGFLDFCTCISLEWDILKIKRNELKDKINVCSSMCL